MWWLVLALLGAVTASIHDNRIGGPETVLSVDDPSSPLFNLISPLPYTGGTYHFVSSTFPEVDSRGFHGGMFDGIGDYYPVWPSVYYKRFYKRGEKEIGDRYPGSGDRRKRSADPGTAHLKDDGPGSERTAVKRGRTGGRIIRGMEMSSSGFHGDVFNSGFGDFSTMKRRSYEPFKRSLKTLTSPISLKEDTERNSGDNPNLDLDAALQWADKPKKRRPEMDAMGFHGDTFGGGFGEFDIMKKRRPEMDAMGFHGDTFGGGFGEFDTMKKRKPEMDAMGFHGDTFGGGFGEFDTMKKRRPEMDAMGFHGDTFGGGFGEFDTMKKRQSNSLRLKPRISKELEARLRQYNITLEQLEELLVSKPHLRKYDTKTFQPTQYPDDRDAFTFISVQRPLPKRRPEMDAMGFHGGVFSNGFGDFETMKKSDPKFLRGF